MVHPFRHWREDETDDEGGIHPLRPDPDEVWEEGGVHPFRSRAAALNEAENAGRIRPFKPAEDLDLEGGIHPFRHWNEDGPGDDE